MAALILPSRRVVQPQGPVEIDWSNPITRGLVACLVDLGSGKFDYVSKKFAAPVGSTIVPAGFANSYGPNYDASNSHALAVGTVNPEFASIFALAIRTAGTPQQYSGPVGVSQSGGANRAFAFETGPGVGVFPDTNTYFSAWNSSGTRFNLLPIFELTPLGQRQTIGLTAGGGSMSAYGNGRLITSGAGPLTMQTLHSLNTGESNGLQWPGFVPVAYLWKRPVAEAEYASLNQAPYQVLRPIQRRIIVDMGAASPIFRPAGDLATTGWTSTGTGFADQINEVTADDLTFVTSPDLLAATPLVISLSSAQNAGTYTARYRQQRTGADGESRIVFMTSGDVDVGDTPWTAAGASFALHEVNFTLSGTATKFRIEVRP